ncbi:hypothetical protein ACFQ0T_24330 [Kitasatospora gansuensis]
MGSSFKVQFWEHRHRPDRRKPYMVRWTVNGREFSESFLTKTQADGRKAELITAARSLEPFDTESGLPSRSCGPRAKSPSTSSAAST